MGSSYSSFDRKLGAPFLRHVRYLWEGGCLPFIGGSMGASSLKNEMFGGAEICISVHFE